MITNDVEGDGSLSVATFDVLDIRAFPSPATIPVVHLPASIEFYEKLRTTRDDEPTLARLLAALERAAAALTSQREPLPAARVDDGLAAHDAYFRLRRIAGPWTTELYARAILSAHALFIRELVEGGSNLAAAQLAEVDRALETMLATAFGFAPPAAPAGREWPATGESPAPMRRWIRGHQIFTVLTQGLVLAVDDVAAAFEAANAAGGAGASRLERAVDRLVTFMRGSAGALRLTGDFSAGDYVTKIRPTMVLPRVPDGFSGLLSSDHRALIARLRKMRPLWDRLSVEAPAIHARVSAVVAYVYDEHKGVCAQFVGTERPSLVSTATTESKSAMEQLESFKASRLKLVAGRT